MLSMTVTDSLLMLQWNFFHNWSFFVKLWATRARVRMDIITLLSCCGHCSVHCTILYYKIRYCYSVTYIAGMYCISSTHLSPVYELLTSRAVCQFVCHLCFHSNVIHQWSCLYWCFYHSAEHFPVLIPFSASCDKAVSVIELTVLLLFVM